MYNQLTLIKYFNITKLFACVALLIVSACSSGGTQSERINPVTPTTPITDQELLTFVNTDYNRELTFLGITNNFVGEDAFFNRNYQYALTDNLTQSATLNGYVNFYFPQQTLLVGYLTVEADFSTRTATASVNRFNLLQNTASHISSFDFQTLENTQISGTLVGSGSVESGRSDTVLESTLDGTLIYNGDSGMVNGSNETTGINTNTAIVFDTDMQARLYRNSDTNNIIALGITRPLNEISSDDSNPFNLGISGTITATGATSIPAGGVVLAIEK